LDTTENVSTMARSSETLKHTLRYLDNILVNDSRCVFMRLLSCGLWI